MNPSVLTIFLLVMVMISLAGIIFYFLTGRYRNTTQDNILWVSRNTGEYKSKGTSFESSVNFETDVPGIYIAGELAGSQTINDALQHGNEAVQQISASLIRQYKADYDLVIVGAGPAGISAALAAREKDLRFILLEQDTLAGAILNHSEENIKTDSPLKVPLEGEISLRKDSKDALISLWHYLILKYHIPLQEYSKVESIITLNGYFTVISSDGQNFTASNVLLAVGMWTPGGKLNIPGENKEKVKYHLAEPEKLTGKNILIVGGNDSAIAAAITLSGKNKVTLSHKKEKLSNLKAIDSSSLSALFSSGQLQIMLKTNPLLIEDEYVILYAEKENIKIPNDIVYIFNDNESTRSFIERCGVRMFSLTPEGAIKN